MRTLLVFLILCLLTSPAISQRLKPEGKFLVDSLRIGEEIPYSLSIKYPVDLEVVFPDSNFNYSPFEFVRKEFFISSLDSTQVTDSVIYHLASFEIDPVQKISLPVFLLVDGDSTRITSAVDSIYLIEMVEAVPDSVALKEDVAFINVNKAFNYPYMLIGLGVLLAVVLIVYFVFGDQIRKRIRLYKLDKAYKKFTDDFDHSFASLRRNTNELELEKLLVIWKKYMEKLEDRPYTKLTSKEIVRLADAGDLSGALKEIDRSIYSASGIDSVFKSFETLEDITGERYKKKVMEVKNG